VRRVIASVGVLLLAATGTVLGSGAASAVTPAASATSAASAASAAATSVGPDATETAPASAAESNRAGAAAAPFACADLLIVGARGSGELDEFGEKVGPAIDELTRRLEGQRTVRTVALDYPAAAMSVLASDVFAALAFHSDWEYFASVQQGTLELIDVLGDSMTYCPNERWILVGYSQGSLVIDQTLMYYPSPERYAGIIKIADPGRESDSGVQNLGEAKPGSGVTSTTSGLPVSMPTNPVPPELTPVTVEICRSYDIVCDTSNALAAREGPAAIPFGVDIHSTGYPWSFITQATDLIADRALALAVPEKPQLYQTICGGSHAVSGQLKLKPRADGAKAATWRIEEGYSPREGVVATPSNFYLGEDGWFTLEANGSYRGNLPTGNWEIPYEVRSGQAGEYMQSAMLNIFVTADCDAPVKCGPTAGQEPEPLHYYDESFVTGRILCPDGRPARGVTVTMYFFGGDWTRTTTNENGTYRLGLPYIGEGQTAQAAIDAELEGFPTMMNGVSGWQWGYLEDVWDHAFWFTNGDRMAMPDYRFTEWGHVKGDVDLSEQLDGHQGGVVFAVGTDERHLQSSMADGGEWCIRGRYECHATPTNDGTFTIRLAPGTYKIWYTTGYDLYSEWLGADEIDPNFNGGPDLDFAARVGATTITVEPSETVQLGTKTLTPSRSAEGRVNVLDENDQVPFNRDTLPVDTYSLVDGTWSKNALVWRNSGWMTNDWFGATLMPGEHKLVINDSTSEWFDPRYETVFYPDAHTLEGAESFTIDRSGDVDLPKTMTVHRTTSPKENHGSVRGRVVDEHGNGLSGVALTLESAELSGFGFQSGIDGTFVLQDVPAGQWTLEFNGREIGYSTEWWNGAARKDLATPLVVAERQDVVLPDVDLARGTSGPGDPGGSNGTLAGMLSEFGPSGLGPKDGWVSVYPVGSSPNASDAIRMQTSGSFLVSVRPGSYHVAFGTRTNAGFVPEQYYDRSGNQAGARIITVGAGQWVSGIDGVLMQPTSRAAGGDRFETSAQLSASEFASGVPVAYIANGLNFPDALSASAVAGVNGGPILLVAPGFIPDAVGDELARLSPERIVILGGTPSVSAAVERDLRWYTDGSVTRTAGSDRFATSAQLSADQFDPGVDVAYVANGLNFPDALAASAVAGPNGGPILLVTPGSIPPAIGDELTRLKPKRIVILGGAPSVGAAVEKELRGYTKGSVTRFAGSDRFDTSARLSAAEFDPGVPVVYVANGLNFPDALAASALAGRNGGPILLVTPTSITPSVAAELERLDPERIVVLGGDGNVSAGVAAQLDSYRTE
jgi:putative cell wall-binding protein